METDKRKHHRFCPENILAKITMTLESPVKKISYEGSVVDMSYTGIKIKLNSPINIDIKEAKINIELTMPESRIPISIRGIIKHLDKKLEYGLQYIEKNLGQDIDNLMFECIKSAAISGKARQNLELKSN